MAIPITYNGKLYSLPSRGDPNWDVNLNTFLKAVVLPDVLQLADPAVAPAPVAGKVLFRSHNTKAEFSEDGGPWRRLMPEDTVFPVDDGAVGDDATDNTDALLASIARASAGSRRIFLTPGTYRYSGSLDFKDLYGLTFCGPARDKAILKWVGASGSPMVKLTNCQNLTIESLQIVGNTNPSNTPSAAIESVSDTTYARTFVPTANIFRDLLIGTGSSNELTYGIRYTNTGTGSDTNNSEGAFQAVKIQGVTESALYLGHSQSKCHHLYDCGFTGGKAGIRTANGSFAWHSGNISNMSQACFDLGSTDDYLLITGLTSEGCSRLLTVGPSGNAWAISFLGGRFDAGSLNADGHAVVLGSRGPLIFRGFEFDQPMKIATNWQTAPGGVVEMVGCNFNWTSSQDDSPIVHLGAGGQTKLELNTYADDTGAAYGQRPDNEALTFNVRRFGALADGVNDDTTAVQAAVDTAKAFGGGVVFFPRGLYRLTDRITVGVRCVDEDDIHYAVGYDYSQGSSFSPSNLTAAEAAPFIDLVGEGASAVDIWLNWTGSTGKSAFFYGVANSSAKVNAYNGRIADMTVNGNDAFTGSPPTLASIAGTAALSGGNHQVGIAAVLSPVKIERVLFRELAKGLLLSDCYWSSIENCQAEHCGDGFTLLDANAGHGRNLTASSCRGTGYIATGQQFQYSGFHAENCAVSIYVPTCDNGRVSDSYVESTYSSDTDWTVKIGDVANAAQNQVIGLSLSDLHVFSAHGSPLRFHSAIYVVANNVRSYTNGSLLNNQYCQVMVLGYPLDFDLGGSDATSLARMVCIGPGLAFKVTGLSTGEIAGLTKQPGLFVFNITTNKLNVCNGTSWEVVTSA